MNGTFTNQQGGIQNEKHEERVRKRVLLEPIVLKPIAHAETKMGSF